MERWRLEGRDQNYVEFYFSLLSSVLLPTCFKSLFSSRVRISLIHQHGEKTTTASRQARGSEAKGWRPGYALPIMLGDMRLC